MASGEDQPLITLDAVVVRRGPREVLSGASLELRAAEVVAVVGPNGAGKSTVIEVAAGMLDLRDGCVSHRIDSKMRPVRRGPEGLHGCAARIGLCMQRGGTSPEETVDEHLNLCLRLNLLEVTEEARVSLLAHWSLAQRRHDRVGWLSGGLRRRLDIAAAMAPALASSEPMAILLDEPSEGLDDDGVTTLAASLDALAARGHGILLATHDQRLLPHTDRSLAVEGGLLVERTEPAEGPPLSAYPDDPAEDASGSPGGLTEPPDLSRSASIAGRPSMLAWNCRLDMRTLSTPAARWAPALLAFALFTGLGLPTAGLTDETAAGLALAPALIAALIRPALCERLSKREAGAHWYTALQHWTPFSALLASASIAPACIAIIGWLMLAPAGWTGTDALWVVPLAALLMVDVAAAGGIIHIQLGGGHRPALATLLLLPFAWVLLMLASAISAALLDQTWVAIKALLAAAAVTWMIAGVVLVIRD